MSDKTDTPEQDRIVLDDNAVITGSPDNPPETVQVFGFTYRREPDYGNDPATKLLVRVDGIARAYGTTSQWAAWAATYIDSIAHNRRSDDALALPNAPTP